MQTQHSCIGPSDLVDSFTLLLFLREHLQSSLCPLVFVCVFCVLNLFFHNNSRYNSVIAYAALLCRHWRIRLLPAPPASFPRLFVFAYEYFWRKFNVISCFLRSVPSTVVIFIGVFFCWCITPRLLPSFPLQREVTASLPPALRVVHFYLRYIPFLFWYFSSVSQCRRICRRSTRTRGIA